MGYYDYSSYNPEEPPEPTLEDHCDMVGHPTEAHIDADGYSYCHCGQYVDSPYGEPHDEYTAACANLLDAYVRDLLNATPYEYKEDNRYRQVRLHTGILLRHKPLSFLVALRKSLNNSNARTMERSCASADIHDYEFFVRMGVHVGEETLAVLNALLQELRGEQAPTRWVSGWSSQYKYQYITDDNISEARIILDLYAKLPDPQSGWYGAHDVQKALTPIVRLIVARPDASAQIAGVFTTHGYNQHATDLIINMLEQNDLPNAALMDGFL